MTTVGHSGLPRDTTEYGHYAGFVSRAAAWIIDMLILMLGLYGMILLGSTIVSLFSLEPPSFPEFTPLEFALTFGIGTFVYLFVGWSIWGKTVGKALLGLRVVRSDGSRLPPMRCVIRIFGYAVSALFFFLGYWWVLLSKRRRGWHDYVAGSCVVYVWEARSSRIFSAVGEKLDSGNP